MSDLQEIFTRLRACETDLATMKVEVESLTATVEKIQGDIRWAIKIVMGAVLLALLSTVVIKAIPSPPPHSAPATASVSSRSP